MKYIKNKSLAIALTLMLIPSTALAETDTSSWWEALLQQLGLSSAEASTTGAETDPNCGACGGG